jgi:hypothetical protein
MREALAAAPGTASFKRRKLGLGRVDWDRKGYPSFATLANRVHMWTKCSSRAKLASLYQRLGYLLATVA